jgi:hypothetical protein
MCQHFNRGNWNLTFFLGIRYKSHQKALFCIHLYFFIDFLLSLRVFFEYKKSISVNYFKLQPFDKFRRVKIFIVLSTLFNKREKLCFFENIPDFPTNS